MSGLRQRLKERTEPHHRRIERSVRLLEPGVGRSEYVRFLEKMFGFHGPLEARFERIPDLARAVPSLEERRKLPLLCRDLIFLAGHDPSRLPWCDDLPAPGGVARALGCLYVLEGSTLGGRVLCRHLGPSLGLDVARGLSFLNSYGESVGAMWRSFLEGLGGWVEAQGGEEEVIEAAVETFIKLERWFSGEGTGHDGDGADRER